MVMKRTVSLLLCVLLLFLACGCSKEKKKGAEKVLEGRLTEMPCYALGENATAGEMRQAALKAHRDALSVQWYTDKDFSYTKIGPFEGERFSYNTREIYCGLPYTMGDTSLIHWLQYYDFSTGKMTGDFTKDISNRLGNACCESIKWAWGAVCGDQMWDFPINVTPLNGVIPVGEYTVDSSIARYDLISTDDICRKNGEEVMYRSYAAALPADLVVSYPLNHCMMVNEQPNIVYDKNGNIDPDKSYLTIEDQRGGILNKTLPYRVIGKGGKIYHYSGNLSTKWSFSALYDNGYLPYTCAQFLGKKPYEKAYVRSSAENPATYGEIEYSYVESNFNIVCASAVISDKDGKEIVNDKAMNFVDFYRKSLIKSKDKQLYLKFALNDTNNPLLNKTTIKSKLKSGQDYNIKISVTVATGETFEVINKTVKYE